MRRGLKTVIGAVAMMALLAGCVPSAKQETTSAGSSAAQTQTASKDMKKIGVVQLMEHTSLNIINDAMMKELKELGYEDGVNCKIDYKNAQGDMSNITSIMQNFAGNKQDVLVTIATPVAQGAMELAKTTPVVFSAVTDPIGAGVLTNMDAPDKGMTGTSDAVQIDKIMELAMKISPQAKKFGYIYNPGEDNYLYVFEISNDVSDKVPINTVNSTDTDEATLSNERILEVLQKANIESENEKGKVLDFGKKNKYFTFKVSKQIRGFTFNVYTLKNITQEDKIYKRLEYLVLIFSMIGVLITIIISKILSKAITKPIKNIVKIAKKINSEDLKERIEVPKREDELQNLTLIINEMLDRLEFSFENQTKFVSDASHELRTPLAIIKGYAEIIKKRRLTNEEIFEESIDSIINETDNMRNLVQKLLFLAKGEITKINTNFVKIDINEMVTQIYSDTVISMTTHQFHLEKGEDFSIQGDETLLQQAIRALIENAVKYSEKGTNVYIKSELKDGIGRISVRDEGVGISEEDAKRVFDRFYRVDLSRTKATGGTGLGLAIVKRIVEIHDGKIEVESKVGKGTEIIIVLPLEGKKVEEVKEEKPQKPQKQHFIKIIEKFRK